MTNKLINYFKGLEEYCNKNLSISSTTGFTLNNIITTCKKIDKPLTFLDICKVVMLIRKLRKDKIIIRRKIRNKTLYVVTKWDKLYNMIEKEAK